MDWLRRNWPDLLIGVALVAVIAGIVATLLTGGSFFPTQTSAPGSPEQPPSVSASAPDEDEDEDPEDAGEDGPGVAVLPPSDGDGGEGGEDVPPGAPDPEVAEDAEAGQAEAPGPAEEEGQRTIEPLAVDEEPADQPGASEADGAGEPQPEDAPDEVASEAAPTAAEADANAELPTEPYRVSVGAFGSEENAQIQAERFRADGFPVFIGRQGGLSLVLVGPYEQESEAEAAAERILAGDYDVEPVIYRFEPDEAGASAPQASAQPQPESESPEAPQAAASEAEAPAAAPPAESDGTVLQVGAYADAASAEPFEERLGSLGFAPRRLREGGFVKIVVGPFSGEALNDARVLLDGAGIEYFAR